MGIKYFLIVGLVSILSTGNCVLAASDTNLVTDQSGIADTYPHITALENAILGQSFQSESLTDRLSRMEKKAFGAISTKPDLSDRTDALDDYTTNKLHKNLLQANLDVASVDFSSNLAYQTQNNQVQDNQTQASSNQGNYPRVTALEQAILGQTFVNQPLADRLSRMEIKAFGSASSTMDLSDRTDALETYAQKKLHIKPLANAAADSTAVNTQKSSSGLLSKVGQTLLGMAMPNLNGVGGTLGRGGGLGYGGGGLGGSGLGYGPMGNGFGGMGMGRNSQSTQKQQPQPESDPPVPVHKEDPAVYQPTPPDTSAKLLTKVGWCEVQVFGHTFPDMHLPGRLNQINQELKLEPGKSPIQLMDDIGLMIKTIQSRKPAANQTNKP